MHANTNRKRARCITPQRAVGGFLRSVESGASSSVLLVEIAHFDALLTDIPHPNATPNSPFTRASTGTGQRQAPNGRNGDHPKGTMYWIQLLALHLDWCLQCAVCGFLASIESASSSVLAPRWYVADGGRASSLTCTGNICMFCDVWLKKGQANSFDLCGARLMRKLEKLVKRFVAVGEWHLGLETHAVCASAS